MEQTNHFRTSKTIVILGWIISIGVLVNGLVALFIYPAGGFLMLISGLAIFPPFLGFIKTKFNFSLSRQMRIGVAVLFFVIGIIVMPKSDNTQTTVNTPAAPVTSSVPLNPLESSIASMISNSSVSDATLQDAKVIDNAMPDPRAGSKYVTIDIELVNNWDKASTIPDTGKLASAIFQQLFAGNPTFDDIFIQFHGSTIDSYGNSGDGNIISYGMDRTLNNQINWTGFPNTGNDANLCAFLREQDNMLSEATQTTGTRMMTCGVNQGNSLMGRENTIETSNPAYRDIPHYGN